MRKSKQERWIRATEHLKSEVDHVINGYHDGSFEGGQAKIMLWHEIDQTIADLAGRGVFDGVLWMRLSAPKKKMVCPGLIPAGHRLDRTISMRYVASRDGLGPDVLYATVAVKNALDAAHLVVAIENSGAEVTDWTYGGYRRSDAHMSRFKLEEADAGKNYGDISDVVANLFDGGTSHNSDTECDDKGMERT